MASQMDRRTFVKGTVIASASAALSLGNQPTAAARSEESTSAETGKPDPASTLPRGKIGNLEISRILLGGNLLTHYTHSRDLKYVYNLAKHYNTEEKILETLAMAEAHGINTLVIHTVPQALKLLRQHREKHGGKMQWIICTTAPMEEGLAQYVESVQRLIDDGTDAIYVWGVRGDALTQQGKVDLIGKAVDIVRAMGVPSGVGAHRLEVIKACEENGVAADFYIKTLHHHNYPSANLNHDSSWCADPQDTIDFMKTVKKPWIAFKVMAAGAIPPANAFRYVFENGADFSLAGMFDYEIAEDVRLAREVLASTTARARPWCA